MATRNMDVGRRPELQAYAASLHRRLDKTEETLNMLELRLEDRPEFGYGGGGAQGDAWQMTLARRDEAQQHIKDLHSALERVGEGTYGRCAVCGQDINPERLEIVPSALLCMHCKRTESAAQSAHI